MAENKVFEKSEMKEVLVTVDTEIVHSDGPMST